MRASPPRRRDGTSSAWPGSRRADAKGSAKPAVRLVSPLGGAIRVGRGDPGLTGPRVLALAAVSVAASAAGTLITRRLPRDRP